MKIFCYRDNLEGEKYKYYGVTLYFVAGVKNIYRVKPKRVQEVSAAIEKWVSRDDPVVAFVIECIKAGIDKTPCYNAAAKILLPEGSPFRTGKRTKVSVRKQNQLALYEYLAQPETTPETAYSEIEANDAFYELVQDHFADELSLYMGGMMYERSGISTCEAPTEVQPNDFIFEIGRLQSARITYYGHYRQGQWLRINMFDEFDVNTLEAILDGNVETGHRRVSRQSTL